MAAEYNGYWGMGIMMESLGELIIVFRSMWTPWEAPSVRKMCYVEGAATPSSFAMKFEIVSRTSGIPREWV